jgi:hypothetical protein
MHPPLVVAARLSRSDWLAVHMKTPRICAAFFVGQLSVRVDQAG